MQSKAGIGTVCPLPGPHCSVQRGPGGRWSQPVPTASPTDPWAVVRSGAASWWREGQVGADLELKTVGEQEGAGSCGTYIIHLIPPS